MTIPGPQPGGGGSSSPAIADITGLQAALDAKAPLASPTLVTPVLGVAIATSINGTAIPSSKTLVVTTDKLSALAATTSAELKGVISDETGIGGALVFADSPALITPALGTPSALVLTNATGLPASRLTGVVPIANLATGTPDGTKFIRDDGVLAVPSGGGISGMRRNAGNTRGSGNTNIIVYGTSVYSDGSDVTHNTASAATNGSLFTINTTGRYTIVANHYASGGYGVYLMKATSATNTYTAANRIATVSSGGASGTAQVVYSGKLTAGDIVWLHAGAPSADNEANSFEIQRDK